MQLNFNATQVAPNTSPEAIETGTYVVIITDAIEKPTQNRKGAFIELEMTIQGGQLNGRKVKERLNVKNDNQQAVEIAYGTLSSICHVTGRMQIQSERDLVGAGPFQIYVTKEPRSDRPGSFSNEIRGYRDMNGNEPGQAGNHGAGGGQGGGQQNPSWAQNGGGQPDQNNGQQNFNQQPNNGVQNGGQNNGGWQGGGQPDHSNGYQGSGQQNGNQGGGYNGGGQQNGGYQHQPDNNQNNGGYNGGGQQHNNGGWQGGGQNNGGQNNGGGYNQNNNGGNNQGGNFGGGQGNGGPASNGGTPDWARS